MNRTVYNHLGQAIGTLEFASDTPEEVIAARLAKYASPPILTSPTITAVQIRKALVAQGYTLDQINGGLNSLPEPTKSLAMTEWEYTVDIPRDHPLADLVATLLGWTTEQVDDLWNQASQL